jgi:hypothetical protein
MNFPSGAYQTQAATKSATPAGEGIALGVLERTSDVLAELHGLLESYAPMWFTEEQHERVETALRELNRLRPSRIPNS